MTPPLAFLLACAAGPVDADFAARVRPVLARHCVSCHGPDKPKGGLRLDTLAGDFASAAGRGHWQAVLKRVSAGEMPPATRKPLSADETRTLAGWVHAKAEARRATHGRVPLRRLNRAEFEASVRDLLGVEIDLQALLPEDMAAQGFDNVAEGQHVSSFLMERLLEAGEKAIGVAVANAPRPPLVKNRLSLKDERVVKVSTESVFLKRDNSLVMFSSSAWNQITVGQHYPPHRGLYRFRISVNAYQSGGKQVPFRVLAGPMLMATKNRLVGYFDAPPGKPTVIELLLHQEARDHIAILPYGLASAQAVSKVGADKYDGPGLEVQWIDVEGPLHDGWPHTAHKRLFGDLPQVTVRGRSEVVSKEPLADAERILLTFARRAFRRDVTKADLAPILALVRTRLEEKHTFEQAVRVGVAAVLVWPDFLFLRERPGTLDDFALAARLSYFLWGTTPDDELLDLASGGKLRDEKVLRGQTERLLKSPRSEAFVKSFVGQWLNLREIDATAPSHILYPEFDEKLKESMAREPEAFFAEMLQDDLPLSNFLASDFSMLNGRLAKHYGIAGVEGWPMKKVKLPADAHRGGVLTMAAVLKVTANGTTTSPVTRGAWVMERILGVTPPRPPADIPAVEPDTRGSTTIREQLAKHREVASCNACHRSIDPPGFALESYDVIGGWRTNYRATARGKPVILGGRRMHYLDGPKVDASGELPDGSKFAGIDDFKKLLLKDEPRFVRAMAERLLTYATGGAPEETDRAAVDAVAKAGGRGLRSLVHAVVQSKLFLSK